MALIVAGLISRGAIIASAKHGNRLHINQSFTAHFQHLSTTLSPEAVDTFTSTKRPSHHPITDHRTNPIYPNALFLAQGEGRF